MSATACTLRALPRCPALYHHQWLKVVGKPSHLKRLLSCAGMPELLEWFLLFLATIASNDAEDRRLAKDGGEVRI